MKNYILLLLLFVGIAPIGFSQNIGINSTGATPNEKAMLDISSTTTGLLIPRMTVTQRDAIVSPPTGLEIFNTTTNTVDVYRANRWESSVYASPNSNLVNVYSLADLPTPSGGAITLDATKMYVFSGIVNISPNYLNLNGANLRGTDPSKDGVMSTVNGGVLRSTGVSVFLENLLVIPGSSATKAYDFADASGGKYCNIFSGCSVVDAVTPSLGVGQISGFEAITFTKNYWSCKDGLKVTGNVGKFTAAYTFITGITAGSGIEFLSGSTINDIDLSNNYFIYSGQTGIKVNAGATIDRGRLTTNMFRDVANPLQGIDSYSLGWSMSQNTDVPNSRAYSFIYFSANTTATFLPSPFGSFYKIQGATTTIDAKRFTTSDNRITYIGVEPIVGKVSIVIGAKAPTNNSDYSIALGKNSVALVAPISSMASTTNNQSFQIILNTEVDLVTGDYLEAFISRRSSTTSLTVEELQFRVTD
jgi:hypothetical protein